MATIRVDTGATVDSKGRPEGNAGDATTSQINRGVIRHPGAVDTSTGPLQAASNLGDGDGSKVGSQVQEGGGPNSTPIVQRAVAAGNFATMATPAKNAWVIMRVATSLAGVANAVLETGAAQHSNSPRNSIHRVTHVRVTFLSGLSWTADKDGQPTYTFTRSTDENMFWSISDGAKAVPNDFVPSASVPGELVYRDGSPNPIQDEYEAKTMW